MKNNMVRFVFLTLVAFVGCYFVAKATYGVFSYYQYSVPKSVRVIDWSVKELKKNQFAILAQFVYSFNGKEYQTEGFVGKEYPNPWAAERAQQQLASRSLNTWINPRHPEKAILEKKFPYKQVVSAAVLIGLFMYFLILSIYMRLKHGQ